jgi:hypothetical protein
LNRTHASRKDCGDFGIANAKRMQSSHFDYVIVGKALSTTSMFPESHRISRILIRSSESKVFKLTIGLDAIDVPNLHSTSLKRLGKAQKRINHHPMKPEGRLPAVQTDGNVWISISSDIDRAQFSALGGPDATERRNQKTWFARPRKPLFIFEVGWDRMDHVTTPCTSWDQRPGHAKCRGVFPFYAKRLIATTRFTSQVGRV